MFGRCGTGRRAQRGVSLLVLVVGLSFVKSAAAQDAGFPVEPPPQATPRPLPQPAPVPVAPVAPVAPSIQPSLPPQVSDYSSIAPAPAVPAAGDPRLTAGLPAILPYREGLPVPAGYHVEERPAKGLLYTGAATLAAGYLGGLAIGLSRGFDGSLGWLAVPVVGVGPAIAGRKFKCTAADVSEARECLRRANTEATTVAGVAIDGMVQVTGLLLLIAGLASSQSELVLNAPVQVQAAQRPGGFDLAVTGRF